MSDPHRTLRRLPALLATGCALLSCAAVAQVEPRPLSAQPLLPVEDAYPHVAADGRLVFQSNRASGSKLFVARADGGEPRQLTSGRSSDATPKWSPDGTKIAYASSLDDNEEVWIINADGSGARSLTHHPAADSHPSWSPDGRQIVFCSTRGDGENDDIYVVNVDGSGLQRLTDNGLIWDTFPSFSPDGGKILFRRLLRQRTPEGTLTNSEIMLMDRDGKNAVNLSKDASFDGWPAWSPDGRRIAFSSNRSDIYQIYLMNADGGNPWRAVASQRTDVRPQWLPDGSGLIFNREHDGRIELWRVALPK